LTSRTRYDYDLTATLTSRWLYRHLPVGACRRGRKAALPHGPSGATAGMPAMGILAKTGPDFNKFGGIRVATVTTGWASTPSSRERGVGVFTHELRSRPGHSDLYDYTGENGTGFWTLMSSGSWMNDARSTSAVSLAHGRLGKVLGGLAEL